MAKEKFFIYASKSIDDCFGRFSESDNKAAISAGTMDQSDPYAWIEASFEMQLRRDREATHICSFTPNAYYIWLKNVFVGEPNEAWNDDGDPDGLECESGGEYHGYGTYRDKYDPRFIAYTFTIDTMKDLDSPMRKPRDSRSEAGERYHAAIWKAAEEAAQELDCNGYLDGAPICGVYEFRKWEKEKIDKVRKESLDMSRYQPIGLI